jgi:hypothetical protein
MIFLRLARSHRGVGTITVPARTEIPTDYDGLVAAFGSRPHFFKQFNGLAIGFGERGSVVAKFRSPVRIRPPGWTFEYNAEAVSGGEGLRSA